MKKRILIFVLCIIMMLSVMNISAFAAEISDVKVEMPNISINIKDSSNEFNKIDKSKVKVSLDGKDLTVNSADVSKGTTEWIILIDTSGSNIKYFEAEKKAIISVKKSLGENDKLSLYSFDTEFVKLLNGNESIELAEKTINALKCDGQNTKFYEATDKLLGLVNESKADNVIPVIFSDGVDTRSKSIGKAKIAEKLAASPVPVYGFYENTLKPETSKAFNDLLSKSKGKASAFTEENAASLLSGLNAPSEIALTAAVDSDVEANEKSVLKIDLGNGKEITKEIKVEKWVFDATAPVILSAKADKEAGTVTVSFSEEVLNADSNDSYIFTTADGSAVSILSVKYEGTSAVLTVDSLDRSGINLKVKNIVDKSNNAAEDKDFVISEVTPVPKKTDFPIQYVLIAVAVLVLILVLILILKKKGGKKPKEEKPSSVEPKAEPASVQFNEAEAEKVEPVAEANPVVKSETEERLAAAKLANENQAKAIKAVKEKEKLQEKAEKEKKKELDKQQKEREKEAKKSKISKEQKKKIEKEGSQFQFYFVDKK